MPTCEPQTVRRDVVRRFVASATSSTERIGLQRTVGGDGETSGRRRGRAGTAAAAPGPRPTVLRPTPNTLSVSVRCERLQAVVFVTTAAVIYSLG